MDELVFPGLKREYEVLGKDGACYGLRCAVGELEEKVLNELGCFAQKRGLVFRITKYVGYGDFFTVESLHDVSEHEKWVKEVM